MSRNVGSLDLTTKGSVHFQSLNNIRKNTWTIFGESTVSEEHTLISYPNTKDNFDFVYIMVFFCK